MDSDIEQLLPSIDIETPRFQNSAIKVVTFQVHATTPGFLLRIANNVHKKRSRETVTLSKLCNGKS